MMKQYLPGRIELALFAMMAILCGLIAHLSAHPDYALALLGMPVFLIAALLGHRRRILRIEEVASEPPEQGSVR